MLSGWANPSKSITATTSNKEKITTLTNNSYLYYPNTLTNSSTGTTIGIATDSPAYKLLFKSGNSEAFYWFNSQDVECYTKHVHYGFFAVVRGCVCCYSIAGSDGSESDQFFGVRPVISLKSEVRVTSDGVISID